MFVFCLGSFITTNRRFIPSVQRKNDYLQKCTQHLWSLALAPSTRKAYSTGLRAFQHFRSFTRLTSPLHRCFDELTLQRFISYCFSILHIRASTIRSYLSSIRYFCLSNGLPDPLRYSNGSPKFSLQQLLHAVEKIPARPKLIRLPITIELLSRICSTLNGTFSDPYWDSLLRAAFCVAFFGFLRAGEFTADKFIPSQHLCLSDLTLTSASAVLFLKRSKTDRKNLGVRVRYFRSNRLFCPIKNLLSYLKTRSTLFPHVNPKAVPLFLMPNGKALSRSIFVKQLRQVLSSLGLHATHYSGHSFRIGAASTAAKAGLPAYLIQILGRWSSTAYQRYIHMSSSTLSKALSSLHTLHK